MEMYLARAMEVGRLTDGQLEVLHFEEEKRGRCLVPHEIQKLFKNQTLKEWYSVPADDTAQMKHNQNLRLQMTTMNLAPLHDFNITDILGAQEFDWKILEAVKDGRLDFYYHDRREGKRLKDIVDVAVVLIGLAGIYKSVC